MWETEEEILAEDKAKAYDRGRRAYLAGKTEGDCPYGTVGYWQRIKRYSWMKGFGDAHENARKKTGKKVKKKSRI
jgi:hypothetical protein